MAKSWKKFVPKDDVPAYPKTQEKADIPSVDFKEILAQDEHLRTLVAEREQLEQKMKSIVQPGLPNAVEARYIALVPTMAQKKKEEKERLQKALKTKKQHLESFEKKTKAVAAVFERKQSIKTKKEIEKQFEKKNPKPKIDFPEKKIKDQKPINERPKPKVFSCLFEPEVRKKKLKNDKLDVDYKKEKKVNESPKKTKPENLERKKEKITKVDFFERKKNNLVEKVKEVSKKIKEKKPIVKKLVDEYQERVLSAKEKDKFSLEPIKKLNPSTPKKLIKKLSEKVEDLDKKKKKIAAKKDDLFSKIEKVKGLEKQFKDKFLDSAKSFSEKNKVPKFEDEKLIKDKEEIAPSASKNEEKKAEEKREESRQKRLEQLRAEKQKEQQEEKKRAERKERKKDKFE